MEQNDAQFDARKISNDAQSGAHLFSLAMSIILKQFLLTMYLSPKHFQFLARGSLCGSFVTNSLEGYRILVPIKTTQNLPK